MEKPTKQEEMEVINEGNRRIICRVLRLTDEEMFDLVWNEGMHYLSLQCGGNRKGIEYMQSEKFYWNWWLNHWNARNEIFIAQHELASITTSLPITRVNTLRTAYEYLHAVAINSEELCKKYCYAMTELTKTESQILRNPKNQMA